MTVLDGDGNRRRDGHHLRPRLRPPEPRPAEGPFSWYVQIVTASGDGIIPGVGQPPRRSPSPPRRVFSAAPDPITPDGRRGVRVPHLEWEPVDGATSYEIWRATVPSTTYSLYKTGLKVSGYTDTGSSVTGSFTYFIRAKNGGATHRRRRHRQLHGAVAPGRTSLLAPAHCPPNTACPVEPNTPTFEWTWNPDATHYRIYLAVRPQLHEHPERLRRRRGPLPALPAHDQPPRRPGRPGHLLVRRAPATAPAPRSAAPSPAPSPGANPPIRAFTKRSNQVQLVAPANEAPGATPLPANGNQIIFDWADYLATNLAAPGTAATALEARNYRVQISTTADMQTIVHTSPFVDQTTYTPFSRDAARRPAVLAGAGLRRRSNALSFSDVRLVHKRSPLVNSLTPADGCDVASRAPLHLGLTAVRRRATRSRSTRTSTTRWPPPTGS